MSLDPLSIWNIISLFPDAKSEDAKKVLKVASVDLNIDDNCLDHHTDCYEITQKERISDSTSHQRQLVVRRGEPFDITITFDRPFEEGKDDIKLIFDVGKFAVHMMPQTAGS